MTHANICQPTSEGITPGIVMAVQYVGRLSKHLFCEEVPRVHGVERVNYPLPK